MNQIEKYQDQKQEIEHFKSLANMAFKSGNYAGMNEMTILNIMLSARDLGVSPYKALNGGFYVVNGKISMSTALMADRIRREGHSIKIPEWTSQKCVVIGVRKDNNDSVKFEFTMEDASAAGLTNSPTWKKFPKQMLYNRAMSTLARTLFPDVVGNAYSEDEKWDILNVPPSKRPEEDPDSITIESIKPPKVERRPLIDVDSALISLKESIKNEGLDPQYLEDCVSEISENSKKPVDQIIESILIPERFAKFKDYYAKEIVKRQPTVSEPVSA